MKSILLAAALGLSAAAANANATFDAKDVAVNSTWKAVLRVPHGCEGEPTLKVRVRIPEGVIAVKPMPKAGWTLETVKGPYARAYALWGAEVKEGVQEIVWTGELLDEHYDEFVFRARITDAFTPGQTLFFPVVQECPTKAERWIQIPAEGQDPDSLDYPAPGVKIAPPAAGH